jgi:hypothetical protein
MAVNIHSVNGFKVGYLLKTNLIDSFKIASTITCHKLILNTAKFTLTETIKNTNEIMLEFIA